MMRLDEGELVYLEKPIYDQALSKELGAPVGDIFFSDCRANLHRASLMLSLQIKKSYICYQVEYVEFIPIGLLNWVTKVDLGIGVQQGRSILK
jgi:hypothetical protein